MKVGIVYHERLSQYDLGPVHPFKGDRFINSIRFFDKMGLLSLPNVEILAPKPATRRDLLRVHDEKYIDLILRLTKRSLPYDAETPTSPQIYEGAMLITGGAIVAGSVVCGGRDDRAVALGSGFHHAGRDYGGGFCLFNDIAVLVEHLREVYKVKRFLILDYDVHFGNGTSDIYYSDPSVLFISLHQDPRTLYPGTGFVEQIGSDEGKGFNINVPLPPKASDETYLHAVEEVFEPLAEEFKPEIILANGGSDAHFADRLGDLGLTTNGFFCLSKKIAEVSERVCNGKLVLMVGSGYNPGVLPMCWYSLISGVVGLERINVHEKNPPPIEPKENRRIVEKTLADLKRKLGKYWKCFAK